MVLRLIEAFLAFLAGMGATWAIAACLRGVREGSGGRSRGQTPAPPDPPGRPDPPDPPAPGRGVCAIVDIRRCGQRYLIVYPVDEPLRAVEAAIEWLTNLELDFDYLDLSVALRSICCAAEEAKKGEGCGVSDRRDGEDR